MDPPHSPHDLEQQTVPLPFSPRIPLSHPGSGLSTPGGIDSDGDADGLVVTELGIGVTGSVSTHGGKFVSHETPRRMMRPMQQEMEPPGLVLQAGPPQAPHWLAQQTAADLSLVYSKIPVSHVGSVAADGEDDTDGEGDTDGEDGAGVSWGMRQGGSSTRQSRPEFRIRVTQQSMPCPSVLQLRPPHTVQLALQHASPRLRFDGHVPRSSASSGMNEASAQTMAMVIAVVARMIRDLAMTEKGWRAGGLGFVGKVDGLW